MIPRVRALRYTYIILLYTKSFYVLTKTAASLRSVNMSYYTRHLYERVANEAAPFVHDPVISNPEVRAQICTDIFSNNGIFAKMQLTACSPKEWYLDHGFVAYSHHQSARPYWRRRFVLTAPTSYSVQEYIFLCPVKYLPGSLIVPYYVSKEYDVGSANAGYKPGRFVFGNLVPMSGDHSFLDVFYVMLAEGPAKFFFSTDFNVELYYLNIRRYIQPGNSVSIDPLCRLISVDRYDANNQYMRICTAVCPIFSPKLYADDDTYYTCFRQEISFRTADGVRASAGRSYFELMTRCRCIHMFSIIGVHEVYISRSYRTDQLLLYQRDRSDEENYYLSGLSTNNAIVDEINSFDFVEN